MKRIFAKIISAVLAFSVILPSFLLLPRAEGGETSDSSSGVSVIYNRGYGDGWNYENGFDLSSKHMLDANITYTKLSASKYEYFLGISARNNEGGYLGIPMPEGGIDSGKAFLEFSFKADAGIDLGGFLMIRGGGDSAVLTHPLAFREGELFIFGENVGKAPSSFTEIAFTFDFDYNGEGDTLVSAEYEGSLYEREYKVGMDALTGVWFGAQEIYDDVDRSSDEYFIDSVKLYYGTDERAELSEKNYGSAVDILAEKTFPVVGAGTSGGYLSGYPDIERYPEGDANVIFNRYFSDGWDIDNGLEIRSTLRENEMTITSDYAAEVNRGDASFLNYYLEFVQRNNKNGFARMDTSVLRLKGGVAYFEFDLKASAGANIPGIIEFITSGSPSNSFKGAAIIDGELYVFDEKVGAIGEDWCHITIRLDFDYGDNNLDKKAIFAEAWIGSQTKYLSKVIELKDQVTEKTGLTNVRIGRLGSAVFREGDWYGIDNIQLYMSETPREISLENFGSLVKADKTHDFVISGGFGEPGKAEIAETALNMKVNSDNALLRGEKVNLFTDASGCAYGGPYRADGKVMVPIDTILDYTATPYSYLSSGLSVDLFSGSNYISLAVDVNDVIIEGVSYYLTHAPTVKYFDGNKVFYICLDDVETLFPGYYVTYDEIGFISICRYDDYLDRETDEEFIRDVMKRFVYDEISPEELYETAKEYTNNFDHPYLYVNQERFDYLYDVYRSTPFDEDIYDADLIKLIDDEIRTADEQLKKYAVLDNSGNYVELKLGQWKYNAEGMASWQTNMKEGTNHSVAVAPYPDSAGYDPAGGRLNVLTDGDSCLAAALHYTAFAYQLTRDAKYLYFAYDWAVALCQWPHWGPAHYLNAANAAYYVALAYDWLYDGFIEEGLDPTPILDGVYKHTTYTAWRSINNLPVEYLRIDGSTSNAWWRHIGNWNPVCSVGVLSACFISFDNPDYIEKAAYTASKDIYYLGQNGFQYFGFDGSYRESAGYWAATARRSMLNVALLEGVLGTDLGISDAPGMDMTNYFGYNLESSDYVSWNYHDDWVADLPSYWYYLSAEIFDNPDFAAIRKMHIDNGKKTYRWDVLWYDKDMIERGSDTLELDYIFTSIDGAVSRSSWESGALYAGIMGGFNNVAHGQYDSGNWIYENMGTRWFVDLGADNYNLYGGGMAMGYYKYSAEGNNTIAVTSLQETIPHGQVLDAGGQVTYGVSNKHGMATVIDQSSVYGGSEFVSYARRGMLVTNDRNTVVIQDEISFSKVQDIYWYAHFDMKNEISSFDISSDGRTVYMYSVPDENGKTYTLRVSLVTGNRGYKFEVWDTYKYMLDATPEPGYSFDKKGIDEGDRTHIMKLVINGKGTLNFDVAVVIELIDPDDPVELGYTLGWEGSRNSLQPMETWVPSADTRKHTGSAIVDEEEPEMRLRPTISGFILNSSSLGELVEANRYLKEDREEFFKLLTELEYTLNYFGRDFTDDELIAALGIYDRAKAVYDSYESHITSAANSADKVASSLIGVQ